MLVVDNIGADFTRPNCDNHPYTNIKRTRPHAVDAFLLDSENSPTPPGAPVISQASPFGNIEFRRVTALTQVPALEVDLYSMCLSGYKIRTRT